MPAKAQLEKKKPTVRSGKTTALFDETEFQLIDWKLIQPDPDQPRKEMGHLEELAASIKEVGLIQPISLTVNKDGTYKLIAGERRYRAAGLAGLKKVPSLVRTVEEAKRLQIQLLENLHRKDLTPFEEAMVFRRLNEEFGFSQQRIAEEAKISITNVNQTMRVLDVSAEVQKQMAKAGINLSKSVLLEIAKADDEQQLELWKLAKQGELTVKAAREAKREPVLPAEPVVRFLEHVELEGGWVNVVILGKKKASKAVIRTFLLAAAEHYM